MNQPAPIDPADSLTDADGIRLLLSTAPPGQAQRLGRTLVEERLAACVNLLPGVRSLYRWKGRVADDPETLLLIKTREDRLPDLARRLREIHPYDVPELLCLTPESGLSPYVDWVLSEAAAQAGDAGSP